MINHDGRERKQKKNVFSGFTKKFERRQKKLFSDEASPKNSFIVLRR
jgi:hypothetical protein